MKKEIAIEPKVTGVYGEYSCKDDFAHHCIKDPCPICNKKFCACERRLWSDGDYQYLICPFCDYKQLVNIIGG